jgi:hypothetical protein
MNISSRLKKEDTGQKPCRHPIWEKNSTKKMSVCLPCNVATELERFKTVKERAKKYS